MNARDQGKTIAGMWFSFANPVALICDASRFDQCVRSQCLKFEHCLYNHIFQDPILEKLLEKQLTLNGVAYCRDGFIRFFKKESMRCSGDMNTSMGNIIIMTMVIFSWIATKGFRVEVINNGDDTTMVCERENMATLLEGFSEHCLRLGFRMKVENPADCLEQVEFCQTRPVFDGTDWIMVRNWPTAFYKDLHSIKPLVQGDAVSTYYHAIGVCGLSLTGGIPCYQEFYQTLMTNTQSRARKDWQDSTLETGMAMLAKGMDRRYSPVSPAARLSFSRAFAIGPEYQRLIESKMKVLLSSLADGKAPRWGDNAPMGTGEPVPDERQDIPAFTHLV
jgi:hypothetical protein